MATSLKKNFLYNAFYNVLVLILPLVTAPYISRIMGAEKIGVYSYSYSVASYFGLFILMGLTNYGNRTIAGVKENKNELSRTFWSIYFMQIIMAIVVIIIYIFYVYFIASDKVMASIQLLYLISVALDINWFFFGMELFKLTVTRNTIIKLLNVTLIFLLVKSKNDIYIYGIIMTIGPLLSQLFLWIFLRRYIRITKITINDIILHIKPNLVLFIPVIAISLYTIMDRVMLGIMSTMKEVGYYENSNKLTQIPVMAITSLGTVMLPRMSNLVANGRNEETKKYIQKSLIISMFLSSSMAFGLSAISKEFVPFFYGRGFEKCINLIPVLLLSSIFISFANVIRTQYLIPYKKDNIYIVSVFLGAFVNMGINLLLIPNIQSVGAAIGTLCAEMTVCIYQVYMVKNEIRVLHYLKQGIPLMISGVLMYVIVINIPFITNYIVTIIIKVVVGTIIYLFLVGIYYLGGLKSIFRKQ
ncbi:oligosaccharide flippase family protein [Longibaculum muris]|uniref:oligosaccharide flippase family protein n=1 Tax=Longibaculum muris TaxID=1796628 RepID=UPI0022DFBC4B|nr:oligosaccharide flippase family protein [Longibaculum muris]